MLMFEEDPVCNRLVNTCKTPWQTVYHRVPYVFCSLECRERFELEPEDYLPIVEHGPSTTVAMLHIVS